MDNLIGRSLDHYHILEQLGEGGMATVYKAYDTRLERDVAVKVIRVDQFSPAVLDQILKRFEREAKSLAKLSHANIVGIIDYGEENDTPYLVMEYLPGGTLKKKLGKPLPWQDAMRLLVPIARALDYAHRQGMIHRDVKPSNIITTADGDPMLTDFGIAKILESADSNTLTGTGVTVGTPEYMAPEQWTGTATPRSDIYSLGVVLYEMITGHKPFMADTPAAVLLKQANEPLPRPTQYVSSIPEAVEKVLLKALAKKEDDRYPDMGSFVTAMDAFLSKGDRTEGTGRLKIIPVDPGATVDDLFPQEEQQRLPAAITDSQKFAIPEQEVIEAAARMAQAPQARPATSPALKDKNLQAWERIITDKLAKGKSLAEIITYMVKSGWKDRDARLIATSIEQRIFLGKWEQVIGDYYTRGMTGAEIVAAMVRSGWKRDTAVSFVNAVMHKLAATQNRNK